MEQSIKEAIHKSVKGLYYIDLIDAMTMKKFDSLCFPEIQKFKPNEIKKIRLREKISQAVLARCLNVSLSSVQHWEIGDKKPNGAALKLLNLIANKGLEAVIY